MFPLATAADVRRLNSPVALLPVGSCEQHGDYLPLTTDTLISTAIADALGEGYGLWVLPPVTVACSHEHSAWRGTASISARTLYAVIDDIYHSADVDHLVIINGHGGNYVLQNVTQETSATHPRSMALFPGRADWDKARADAGCFTNSHADMHGGELETSVLLYAHPDAVRPGYETADHEAPERPHLLTLGMTAYTTNGIIGRPSLASAAKGKDLLTSLTTTFGHYLQVLTSA